MLHKFGSIGVPVVVNVEELSQLFTLPFLFIVYGVPDLSSDEVCQVFLHFGAVSALSALFIDCLLSSLETFCLLLSFVAHVLLKISFIAALNLKYVKREICLIVTVVLAEALFQYV